MMSILSNIDGSFYNDEYYESGRTTGKSWLMNYSWMPRRSFREALTYIDYLNLDENSCVLDLGCAKGFTVRALRELEIKTDGCDISSYALSFAPKGCWNCSDVKSWDEHTGYTHIILKDVFEHLTVEQLNNILLTLKSISPIIMCVIPIGDNGIYRIPEYHLDKSHIIAENEEWWSNKFIENGWNIKKECSHLNGIKDNWLSYANGLGNHIYVLEKIKHL